MEKLMNTVKKFFTGVIKYFTKGRNAKINPNDKNTLDDCKNVKINTKKLDRVLKLAIGSFIILLIVIIVLIVALINVNLRVNGQTEYITELETQIKNIEAYKDEVLTKSTETVNNLTKERDGLAKENEELKKEIETLKEKISSYETTKKATSYQSSTPSNNRPSVTVSRSGDTRQAQAVQATADERTLLAKIIYAEAGGSSEEDMLLVGNVVMNRVEHEKFPNTIYNVIYAKGQYSPTWNGAINKTPSELAYKCADRLLAGERFCPSNVVYQAQFKQGSGIWKQVGNHYYCYI